MRLTTIVCLLSALTFGCGSKPDGIATDETYGLTYAGSVRAEQAELSAPLAPDSRVYQAFQDGTVYPMLDAAARLALIDDSAYAFDRLLVDCAASRPAITLAPTGALSQAQLRTNYEEVARCAYDQYGAKPYWVPRQIDELDVCARKLGAGWRLPTEADVRGLSEPALSHMRQTLMAAQAPDLFPTHFYFSLRFYVRGADGALAVASLSASPIEVLAFDGALDALYIGDGQPIGLRCVPSGR